VKVRDFDIDLIPANSWNKSLAKKWHGSKWDNIRKREYKRAHYKCELCGSGNRKLICHEKWNFDDVNHVQKLVGYEVVCEDCNLVMHLGYAGVVGKMELALSQLMKLTGYNQRRINELVEEIFDEWSRRSKFTWKIDVSLENKDAESEQIKLFSQ
jgi:hypothetical protein